MARTVFVTGTAGFIGAALSQRLLQRGDQAFGLYELWNGSKPDRSPRKQLSIDLSLPFRWRSRFRLINDPEGQFSFMQKEFDASVSLKLICTLKMFTLINS